MSRRKRPKHEPRRPRPSRIDDVVRLFEIPSYEMAGAWRRVAVTGFDAGDGMRMRLRHAAAMVAHARECDVPLEGTLISCGAVSVHAHGSDSFDLLDGKRRRLRITGTWIDDRSFDVRSVARQGRGRLARD